MNDYQQIWHKLRLYSESNIFYENNKKDQLKLIAYNSFNACSLAKILGYFFIETSFSNSGKGFKITSPLTCENNVDETLQQDLPYLKAISFFISAYFV
jgi:hypothetical protein